MSCFVSWQYFVRWSHTTLPADACVLGFAPYHSPVFSWLNWLQTPLCQFAGEERLSIKLCSWLINSKIWTLTYIRDLKPLGYLIGFLSFGLTFRLTEARLMVNFRKCATGSFRFGTHDLQQLTIGLLFLHFKEEEIQEERSWGCITVRDISCTYITNLTFGMFSFPLVSSCRWVLLLNLKPTWVPARDPGNMLAHASHKS